MPSHTGRITKIQLNPSFDSDDELKNVQIFVEGRSEPLFLRLKENEDGRIMFQYNYGACLVALINKLEVKFQHGDSGAVQNIQVFA